MKAVLFITASLFAVTSSTQERPCTLTCIKGKHCSWTIAQVSNGPNVETWQPVQVCVEDDTGFSDPTAITCSNHGPGAGTDPRTNKKTCCENPGCITANTGHSCPTGDSRCWERKEGEDCGFLRLCTKQTALTWFDKECKCGSNLYCDTSTANTPKTHHCQSQKACGRCKKCPEGETLCNGVCCDGPCVGGVCCARGTCFVENGVAVQCSRGYSLPWGCGCKDNYECASYSCGEAGKCKCQGTRCGDNSECCFDPNTGGSAFADCCRINPDFPEQICVSDTCHHCSYQSDPDGCRCYPQMAGACKVGSGCRMNTGLQNYDGVCAPCGGTTNIPDGCTCDANNLSPGQCSGNEVCVTCPGGSTCRVGDSQRAIGCECTYSPTNNYQCAHPLTCSSSGVCVCLGPNNVMVDGVCTQCSYVYPHPAGCTCMQASDCISKSCLNRVCG